MNALPPARVSEPLSSASLGPGVTARVMRGKGDLRLGVPVVLTHGDEAALIVAVEALSAERFGALMTMGALPQLALTRHRAAALGLKVLPVAKAVAMGLPASVDLAALHALADPKTGDAQPAAAPLIDSPPEITAGRPIHRAAIALAKAAQLLPAALVISVEDGVAEATRHGLSLIAAEDVLAELNTARVQNPVSSAALPMAAHQAGRVHVFRPDDGGIEHYAIEIGKPDPMGPVLVRLHSACFTGDVMGSLKCDCGPQLQAACATMAEEGGGVLLYLNQEGRGIGMANKMRAYALQDAGYDTVEANNHLGFDDDERDFRIGSALLSQMGISSVRLLTNNPAKVRILQAHGIAVVERVPLEVGKTEQNARYLATKALKSGHLLK
ncbi:MAG: GTP cyclohydrolase II [Rhodobacterales bacterium]